jgi:tetratricopeptide (TPR) repeat protein
MYPLGYVPHNWHFAVLSAGLQGSRTLAEQAAAETFKRVDMGKLDALNFMQHGTVAPLFTRVRFGEWDRILAMPGSPADRPYPTGIWHFARGMAQLRKGDKAAARVELDALSRIASDPAMEKLVLGDLNRADLLLKVGERILRGELAIAEGRRDPGLQALREAIAIEDTLNYNEPADWPLPARNYLGAALVGADKPREAIEAFTGALKEYPKNGWSLYGLAQAQRALGDATAADATMARQQAAWAWADTPLRAAVF